MIVDLTHRLYNGMPVYPGTEEPLFKQTHSIIKDSFAELMVSMTTHTGTHIDAPSHVLPGARSLTDFDISHFIGPAGLIDVAGKDVISRDFLGLHEAEIAQAKFVILRSGWQHKWTSEAYFSGYPVLSAEASAWLSAQNLNAVGIDAISIDAVEETSLPNHHALLSSNTLIVENLTNLDRISANTFEFCCLPMHIQQADGAPVRAYARISE